MEFAELQKAMCRARREGSDWAATYGRANDLLTQFRESWTAGFTSRFRVEEVRFQQGKISEIVIGADDYLRQFEAIAREYPDVRHVQLRGSKELLQEVVSRPMSRRLRSLSLEENELEDDDVVPLLAGPPLAELRWLSLAFNELTAVTLRRLAKATNLPGLEVFQFGGNRDPDPGDDIIYDAIDGSELRREPSPLGLELEQYAGKALAWLHLPPKYGPLAAPLPMDLL